MPDRKAQEEASRRPRKSAACALPTAVLDTKDIDTTVPKLPVLMTVEQTAAALGLCAASVRTAIENGEIPAQVLNGRWRVPTAQLLDRWNQAEAVRLQRLRRARRGLQPV